MKKEKRIKKRLTSKQARNISLLIGAIALVLVIVLAFISYTKIEGKEETLLFVILCIAFPVITFMFCYNIVLKGNNREFEERYAELEKVTKEFLKKEEFTEVFFTPEDHGDETKMILGILEKSGCRFFAKLDESDKIILIVKDKNNDEIWNTNISNYSYFDAKFEKEKN